MQKAQVTAPQQKTNEKKRGSELSFYRRCLDHHPIFYYHRDMLYFIRGFITLKERDQSFNLSYQDFVDLLNFAGAYRDTGQRWTIYTLKEYIGRNIRRVMEDFDAVANLRDIFNKAVKQAALLPSQVGNPAHAGKAKREEHYEKVKKQMGKSAESIYSALDKLREAKEISEPEKKDMARAFTHWRDVYEKHHDAILAWADLDVLYRRGEIFQNLPSLEPVSTPAATVTAPLQTPPVTESAAQIVVEAVKASETKKTPATDTESPQSKETHYQFRLPLAGFSFRQEMGVMDIIENMEEKQGREQIARMVHQLSAPPGQSVAQTLYLFKCLLNGIWEAHNKVSP